MNRPPHPSDDGLLIISLIIVGLVAVAIAAMVLSR